MKKVVIYAFYRFVALPHFANYRDELLNAMLSQQILGSILIADEGINGTIAGANAAMQNFWRTLCAYPEFNNLPYKVSVADFNPFEKAKVKLRNEIVSLGVDVVHPIEEVGEYVKPNEWNALLQDKEVLVIDTRNEYEVEHGSFLNAINPKTLNFRDFPEFVAKNLLDKKAKKIAMYCTGGIRCEKSTAYLKKLGFSKVYHLEGGILKYLEEIPVEKSLWQGNCFVFDDRIAVDKNLNTVPNAISNKHTFRNKRHNKSRLSQ